MGILGRRWVHGLACLAMLAWAGGAVAGYRLADDRQPPSVDSLLQGSEGTTASDGVRYLVVVDQVDLSAARPAWYRRVAYDVMHERGLASAGQFSIHYQPAYQDVVLHAVDVWRDGVRIDRRDDSRIEVLRRESGLEAGLLDGSHTLSVTVPDIRVGDRVDYRYTVHGYNPVFGRGYHDYWTARYGVPVALREIRVVHPRSMRLSRRAGLPGFEQDEGVDGGLHWWRLRGRDLAGTADEDSVPEGHALLERAEVTTAEGWGDVARWALPLYPGRFADRALAADLARQLRLDPGDPSGSLERAVAFVQGEVRYTGLDMGLNSHAPNPPERVVQRRFGDCKDKSHLLIALLREAGIEAEPVLVNTDLRARTAERLPGPLAFDHVVVRAHLPQGGEVWIDPTRSREEGPIARRPPLGFGVGLPVAAGATGLATIPYPFPAQPEIEVEQRLDFASSAPHAEALFVVDTLYRSGYASGVRDRFRAEDAQKIGEGYLAYMRGYYDGLESGGAPELEEEGSDARVSERYRLRWNAEEEGNVFGIIPFQLLDWAPRLADRSRSLPLSLSGPRFARHTVRSRHPEGWAIQAEHERVENPWFRFDRHVSVDDKGEFVIVAEWRRLADQVPADGYAKAREDLRRVRDLLEYEVDLQARWQLFGTGLADWAWPIATLCLALVALPVLWWQRRRWVVAGMLYRPRATVASRLAGDGLAVGVAVGLCAILVELLLQRGGGLLQKPSALAAGMLLLGLVALGLRWLFLSWVLRVTLGILGHHVGAHDMRRTYGLALAPMGLFLALAILALGFQVHWLDDEVFEPERLPAVLTAVLWMFVGTAWWLVALAAGSAGLAGVRTRRGMLALGISVLPLVVVATLVMVAVSL